MDRLVKDSEDQDKVLKERSEEVKKMIKEQEDKMAEKQKDIDKTKDEILKIKEEGNQKRE